MKLSKDAKLWEIIQRTFSTDGTQILSLDQCLNGFGVFNCNSKHKCYRLKVMLLLQREKLVILMDNYRA